MESGGECCSGRGRGTRLRCDLWSAHHDAIRDRSPPPIQDEMSKLVFCDWRTPDQ